MLERRCEDNSARDEELTREIAAAESGFTAMRKQIFSATEELEMGRVALARLDRKLSLNSRVKELLERRKKSVGE